MKLIVLHVMLTLLFAGPPEPGSQVQYEIEEQSRLWIEGKATTHRFDCTAGQVNGEGLLEERQVRYVRQNGSLSSEDQAHVQLAVPVERFDCGKRRMNRDLFKALRADEHESIRFHLESYELTGDGREEDDGWYDVHVVGELEVAGVSRHVDLTVRAQTLSDERVRVQGQADVLMSDFDVDPPSAMLGVIQVRDELTVHFDLYARLVD